MNEEKEEQQLPQPVHLDIYGIKLPVAPQSEDAPPESMREVLQRAWRHVRTIADAVLGLPADAVTAARRVVRGVGALPSSIASRIAQGKQSADKAEAAAQQNLLEGKVPTPVDAIEQFEHLKAVLAARGITLRFHRNADGTWTVLAVHAVDEASAIMAAKAVLLPDLAKPEPEKSGEFDITFLGHTYHSPPSGPGSIKP